MGKSGGRAALGLKGLLWLAGVLGVGALIWGVGWERLGPALALLDARVLALLVALQALTLGLCAGLLWYTLRCSGIRLPYGRVLSIYLTGGFVESVTPSLKFGGEAVKVYLLKRATRADYQHITGAFLIYKLLSMTPFTLLLLLAAGVVSAPLGVNLRAYALGPLALGGGLGLWLLVRRRGPGRVGDFLARSVSHARRAASPRQLAAMLGVATCIWILYPVKLQLIAASIGVALPFIPLIAVLYTGYLVSMLPLAPGGLGSFEGALVFLLGRLGVAAQSALALTLLLRSVTYWLPLLPSGYCAARMLWRWRPPVPWLRTQTPPALR